MNTVPEEIVEQTWEELSDLSFEESEELIHDLTEEQPYVLAYLMGIGTDILNEGEREVLLYLGMTVWKMMDNASLHNLPRVTDIDLDAADKRNLQVLETLEGESPGDFYATVKRFMTDYNQPEILKFVVETLMEEEGDLFEFDEDDEEIEEVREEMKGMMMIFLKTLIDSLDK